MKSFHGLRHLHQSGSSMHLASMFAEEDIVRIRLSVTVSVSFVYHLCRLISPMPQIFRVRRKKRLP